MASGRFDNLDYEGFRKLAVEKDLSRFERIGFPDTYRDGHEAAIFMDVRTKLPKLESIDFFPTMDANFDLLKRST